MEENLYTVNLSKTELTQIKVNNFIYGFLTGAIGASLVWVIVYFGS